MMRVQGFILVTDAGALQICQLPSRTLLHAPWLLQKAALRASVLDLCFHRPTGHCVLLTAKQARLLAAENAKLGPCTLAAACLDITPKHLTAAGCKPLSSACAASCVAGRVGSGTCGVHVLRPKGVRPVSTASTLPTLYIETLHHRPLKTPYAGPLEAARGRGGGRGAPRRVRVRGSQCRRQAARPGPRLRGGPAVRLCACNSSGGRAGWRGVSTQMAACRSRGNVCTSADCCKAPGPAGQASHLHTCPDTHPEKPPEASLHPGPADQAHQLDDCLDARPGAGRAGNTASFRAAARPGQARRAAAGARPC